MSERSDKGQFMPGNSGGPGRPRRAIEGDYLATLADMLPLDVWRNIVQRAIDDALKGDARARAWLAQYVLGLGVSIGEQRRGVGPLLALAVREERGQAGEGEVKAEARVRALTDL